MYSEHERREIIETARRNLSDEPQDEQPLINPLVERRRVPDYEPEDAMTKWRREADALKAEERTADAELRAARDAEVAAARRHEIALARAWTEQKQNAVDTIDWPELLGTISDTFSNLADRVEAIEKRLSALEHNNSDKRLAAKLDAISARGDKAAKELREQVATLKEQIEKVAQRAEIECRMVKIELAATKKAAAEPTVVHHHVSNN